MRRTVTLTLALLLLAAPVQAQSSYTPFVDFLSKAMECSQGIAAPEADTDEMIDIAERCAAELMEISPSPCYQGAWAALWATLLLTGEALRENEPSIMSDTIPVFTVVFTESIAEAGSACFPETGDES